MLKEVKTVDVIQILEDGSVSVRMRTDVIKNDVEVLASSYARNIITPGEYELARELLGDKYNIVNALWTEEVLTAYKKKISQLVTQKPQ